MKYFNVDHKEISKNRFDKLRATHKFLDVPGDTIGHIKLVERVENGKIEHRKTLQAALEKELKMKLDADKPLVKVYYPGKDPCNSSGTNDKKRIKDWHDDLHQGLEEIAQVKPIYIYKKKEGLEKYKGILEYYKDPDARVENLFFKYHYPCRSFVVISKDGDYVSYFGEFGKKHLWNAVQILNK